MEKVSVIVPIYNAEENIEKCLNSILNQTYKNFEIICINDGSKDNTQNILENYVRKDTRIIVVNKENSGPSDTRNLGIKKATGKYIIFVDADDNINENMIEALVSKQVENNAELVICNFYYEKDSKIKNKLSNNKIFTNRKEFLKKFDYYYTKTLINPPWNKLYLKDKIKDKFDSNLILGEDLDFNIKYFNEIQRTATIDEYLYNYNINNSNSITSKVKSDSKEYFNLYLKLFNNLFFKNKVNTSVKFDLFFIKDYIAHCFEAGYDKEKIIDLYIHFYKDIQTINVIDKFKKRIIFSKLNYLLILNIYVLVKKRK